MVKSVLFCGRKREGSSNSRYPFTVSDHTIQARVTSESPTPWGFPCLVWQALAAEADMGFCTVPLPPAWALWKPLGLSPHLHPSRLSDVGKSSRFSDTHSRAHTAFLQVLSQPPEPENGPLLPVSGPILFLPVGSPPLQLTHLGACPLFYPRSGLQPHSLKCAFLHRKVNHPWPLVCVSHPISSPSWSVSCFAGFPF